MPLLGALLLGVILCAPAAAQSTARALELFEVAAVAVPDSIPFSSVAVSARGDFLLWSPTRGVVTFIRGETFRPLGAGRLLMPVAAAFVDDSGGFDVVDAQLRSLVHFGPNGEDRGESPLPVEGAIRNAVLTAAGWVLGVARAQDGFRVLRVHDGGPTELHRSGAVSGEVPEEQLSPDGDGVLVSDLAPPFVTYRLGPGGELRGRFDPPTLPPVSGSGSARWFPMPVVALEDGYLQVIADLASDVRLFVLYDREGRTVRQSEVRVPMAFVASSPSRRILVGSRGIGEREVISFGWEWKRGISP